MTTDALRVPRLPSFLSGGGGEFVRFGGALVLALAVFAVVISLQGSNPVEAYRGMLSTTLGSKYGLSEVLVRMIPLLLAALAVAIPARVGLVNVGGEGQIYLGAMGAAFVALSISGVPAVVALPLMAIGAAVAAGIWALIPAFFRAKGWLNETISTLLLNYVGILLVQYFVFGPWKDPQSANFPQSRPFESSEMLPTVSSIYRVHAGLIIALVAAVACYLFITHTRWGFEMKAVGGNPEAARRSGISLTFYLVGALIAGGVLAGLAGFGEVSALQGRLRPSVSPGYGYTGFLISWLAGHHPLAIIGMSFVLAVLTAGGDSLQIGQGLPFASVNLLMALTLFAVLAMRGRKGATA